jgi:hypothetical protein
MAAREMTDTSSTGVGSNNPPPPAGSPSAASGSPQSQPQWYEHIALVIVACFCCWPIGIALIWINRSWTQKSKVIATSIIVAIGLIFGGVTILAGANTPKTEGSSSLSVDSSTSTTASTLSTSTTSPSTTIAPTTTVAPSTTTTTKAAPTTTTKVAALMPNVVGLNLQDAQDTIQDAGVFFSRSYDCTGAGRSQIVESSLRTSQQVVHLERVKPFLES